jgi:hypothetical protein
MQIYTQRPGQPGAPESGPVRASAHDVREGNMSKDQRLTTSEVARFVADGFLRFEALVPDELNDRVIGEMQRLEAVKLKQFVGQSAELDDLPRPASLTPLSRCYPQPSVLGQVLRLPRIQGIIQSLVGSDPLYDHDFVHHLPAGSPYRQHLHVDAVIDTPDPSFDIQLFYFPRAVAPGAGGTRFIPGSHLRRTRAEGVSRYQHLLGEEQYSGPDGSVLVFHHGLWHAGQPNPSAHDRWMYKIRLNPTVSQVRLWNIEDLAEVHNDASDHIFATARFDSVAHILRQMQPWQQGHESRYELMERARLWRYLSGDDEYDVDYYFTRLEQRAQFAQQSII